jgi:hypothetical protein
VRARAPAIAACALTALAAAPPVAAQEAGSCIGDVNAADVAQTPGAERLRFGIGPLVQAGQIGPTPSPAVPEQPQRTHDALARLRPPRGAYVLRLNRFFWSDGEAGIRRYLDLASRFTGRGYLVELQVRYHPTAEQEGDIEAWKRHVREVVRRFGTNPRVVALQIANEVNITFSADSSDGAYEGAREALVQGVIAAKDEVRRRGYRHLEIGFNWAYRTDPGSEESFWRGVRDRGGAAFVRSLDWIGLDAYPGTVFPPIEPTMSDYRDGMVNAMSTLRCFARTPGIPPSVPMKVEENGWPTFPGRSRDTQAEVLRTMVAAVHDYRGTYNVSDYRWFNLRDGDSSSPQPFQHFGLLDSGYVEKPAFAAYRDLTARLARSEPATPGRPRLSLALRFRSRLDRRGRRCARGPVRATVTGRDRALVTRVRFRLDRRRRTLLDVRRPHSRVVHRAHGRRSHAHRVRVFLRTTGGGTARLTKRFRACS